MELTKLCLVRAVYIAKDYGDTCVVKSGFKTAVWCVWVLSLDF